MGTGRDLRLMTADLVGDTGPDGLGEPQRVCGRLGERVLVGKADTLRAHARLFYLIIRR